VIHDSLGDRHDTVFRSFTTLLTSWLVVWPRARFPPPCDLQWLAGLLAAPMLLVHVWLEVLDADRAAGCNLFAVDHDGGGHKDHPDGRHARFDAYIKGINKFPLLVANTHEAVDKAIAQNPFRVWRAVSIAVGKKLAHPARIGRARRSSALAAGVGPRCIG